MIVRTIDKQLASASVNPTEALALLTGLFGFEHVHELGKGVWLLGRYRNRSLYYAARSTDPVGAFLATDSRAIFIYGQAVNGELPSIYADHGRCLTQVVERSREGKLVLVSRELDAIAAPRTAGLRPGGVYGKVAVPSGLDLRLAAWLIFIDGWLHKIVHKSEREGRHPPWKAIHAWFCTEAPPAVRACQPGMRTLKRDVAMLLKRGTDARDRRSSDFIRRWHACLDIRVAARELDNPLPDVVTNVSQQEANHAPSTLPPLRPDGRQLYQAS